MNFFFRTAAISLFVTILALSAIAQNTEISFQGSLQNLSAPANGNFDFEFALFDSLTGGVQQGATLTRSSVAVANGTFAVKLDFGGQFPGANRFLEIRVRQTGGGVFTPLTPRQTVNSSPYAVRSLNAANADSSTSAVNATTAATATNALSLGGVAANQYVLTGDPRLSDPRPPTAGSTNYIQNQNAAPQASSNFNISGNGIAGGTLSGNTVNTATQYNISGNRIFTANGSFSGTSIFASTNTFAGDTAGINTSPNPDPTGSTGKFNSFYGAAAGKSNSTGYGNSFFGGQAGSLHITGAFNSFFGLQTGYNNTLGSYNSFFGAQAGYNNSFAGGNNSFFGSNAGYSNTSGNNNTIVGTNADVLSNSLTNAGAFGYQAAVAASNSLVLGSINGINGATANTNVGVGTTTPIANLHVQTGGANTGRIQVGSTAAGGDEKLITFGDSLCPGFASCVYIGERNFDDRMELRAGLFYFLNGPVQIANFSTAGSVPLCVNGSSQISSCSSSLRYKTNIGQFSQGMSFVNQLRPISFQWKDGGMKDVGFGAEDIAKIDPRFVTYNKQGEVEGVKYDRLSVAFVNAFKEQQAEIESLRSEIRELRTLLCAVKSRTKSCRKVGVGK